MNDLSNFLKELRKTNPNILTYWYLNGSCLQLYRIVKAAFPEVEPWGQYHPGHPANKAKGIPKEIPHYSHIWIKWRGDFYDIKGKLTSKRKNSEYNGYGCNLKPFPYDPNKRYTWGNGNNKGEIVDN